MAQVCGLCQSAFGEDDSIVNVGDLSAHPKCFNCDKCGLNFIEGNVVEFGSHSTDAAKIGQPYPSGNKFNCGSCLHGTCHKCGKQTIGPHLTVEGKLYHRECFDIPKCVACNKEIYGKYIVVEGKGSLHEECYP
jgi:hypothetical protein